MLIDLHAHAPHPGYYNQHPHWGPFFEQHEDGDVKLRVGDWILTLGSPERKAAVRSGKGLKLDEYFARCGCDWSAIAHALYRSSRAAAVPVSMSASLNWMAWKELIGLPNCRRSRA